MTHLVWSKWASGRGFDPPKPEAKKKDHPFWWWEKGFRDGRIPLFDCAIDLNPGVVEFPKGNQSGFKSTLQSKSGTLAKGPSLLHIANSNRKPMRTDRYPLPIMCRKSVFSSFVLFGCWLHGVIGNYHNIDVVLTCEHWQLKWSLFLLDDSTKEEGYTLRAKGSPCGLTDILFPLCVESRYFLRLFCLDVGCTGYSGTTTNIDVVLTCEQWWIIAPKKKGKP